MARTDGLPVRGLAVWFVRGFALRLRLSGIVLILVSAYLLVVGLRDFRTAGSGDLLMAGLFAGVGMLLLLIAWPLARYARTRAAWPPK